MVEHLGLAPLAAIDPVDEAELVLGLAMLAVAECHWSPSLFSTVISGCIGGIIAAGVLWASPRSLVASSGHSRKLAKSVGNCSASPRSSRFGSSNNTCLHVVLLDGWASSSGVPWLKEFGNCSPLCWGCDRLSETCLEGHWAEARECTGPPCDGLWCHCSCQTLCMDWECLLNEASCGCLMLVASQHSCLVGEWVGVCPLTLGEVWKWS